MDKSSRIEDSVLEAKAKELRIVLLHAERDKIKKQRVRNKESPLDNELLLKICRYCIPRNYLLISKTLEIEFVFGKGDAQKYQVDDLERDGTPYIWIDDITEEEDMKIF